MDLDLGVVSAEGKVVIREDDVQRIRQLVTDKPLCDGCFCRWTCAGGCHVCHSCPGVNRERSDFCTQTRIITACRMLLGMGCPELAQQVLGSRSAMEAVALRATDRVVDWAA